MYVVRCVYNLNGVVRPVGYIGVKMVKRKGSKITTGLSEMATFHAKKGLPSI